MQLLIEHLQLKDTGHMRWHFLFVVSPFYHKIFCVSILRVVLIFTHIPTYKYKLVDPTLCVKLFLRTHYTHICVYALLINEGPGLFNNRF